MISRGLIYKLFGPSLLLALSGTAWAGGAFTVQGRITDPSNAAMEDSSVQIRVKVLAPDANLCTLYDETQTINMTGSGGLFSISLGNGTGTQNAPVTYTVEQAFSNFADLTVSSAYCSGGAGSVVYSPAYDDQRKVLISFKSSAMAAFEDMPLMTLTHVPMAMEAIRVGGYPAHSLLRVESGGAPASIAALSGTDFTEFQNLVGGTSSQYMQYSATNGTKIPSLASPPSSLTAGCVWFDSGSSQIKYYDGTTTQTIGSGGGGTGDIDGVTAGTGLSGGGTSGTVTLNLANTAVTAGSYGSASEVATLTVDAQGRITAAGNTTISGVAPGGAAGGDLAGTYPNPTLATSGVTAGTYNSVTVDAKGRVTGGTNPTTLSGYGIVDSVQNVSGVPSMQSGTDAAKPAAGTAGRLYIATDTQTIYRDSGAAWVVMSSASGSGGDIDGVTAGTGLSGGGTSGTVTLNLADTAVTAGSYGSTTKVPSYTVDAQGRITAASEITITGVAPGGAAGGDLTGTYPSPNLSTTGVSAGTYKSVTVDTKGRVTGGTNPSTLSGYSITDAVQNVSGVPSIQAGVDASIPAAGTAGRIYIATDTLKTYRDNGTSWDTLSTASGGAPGGAAGGDLTGTYPNPTLSTTGVSAGTYKSVTVDTKGRITAATNPTTLSGFGITDAVKNDGTTPSIQSGADASKPAAGTAGKVYIASDTFKIYRDNGATWDEISPSGTAAGDIEGVTAGTGLSGGGTSGTVTVNLADTAVTPGSYGTATKVPSYTVDAQGRITAASEITITGVAPGGAAGGDLTGTYPNPDLTTTGVSAGTYKSVTVDTKGRVTAATNPTTLSSFGITDGVQNVAGVPSIQAGVDASIPAAGTAGRIYIATDTLKTYRDNGTTWDTLSSATGAAPGGSAGGDLTGTYPNPTLATTGVSAGTYKSVTVDTKGRITAATNPTTLSGFGITDAVKNDGSTPSIASGADAARPAAGTSGRVYLSTDGQKVYRDNGATWDTIASNATATGDIESVTAGTGLSGGGTSGAVTLNLANTAVSAGSYGSATKVPSYTVDAQGRITAAADVTITGVTPGGSAGGDLTGTYPNPTLTTSGVTAGTYKSVTVDAKGRVTAATNPTTLSGFGITDGVQNVSGVPSIQASTTASRPAAGTAGRLYISTDNGLIYRDNGSSWDTIGSSLWQDGGSNKIYYSAGNVGIGASPGAAKLDVAGEVKFGNTSSTCNATNEGQQRYNSTTKTMQFCDGSLWRTVGSPFIGSVAFAAAANCYWNAGTTGSWVSYSTADSDCAAATESGSATSPGKYPALAVASLTPGRYRIRLQAKMSSGDGSGSPWNNTASCGFRLYDGSTAGPYLQVDNNNGQDTLDGIEAEFYYASAQTNITFYLQYKRITGTGTCVVAADSSNTGTYREGDILMTLDRIGD